jgi:putative salt-induced outer membrane protein YdiY
MKIKLIGFALLMSLSIQSQIINTESLRMVTDTTGWSGSVGLNIGFSKHVTELFKIKNDIHVQYKTKKHLVMFVNKISFEKANNADFVNKGVQHLRYNYRISSKLAWEFFLQNQYNAVSKIDSRKLVGIGIRYKLTKSEKYKIYFGSLAMYEYEKTSETPRVINRDWRNSSYLSFSLYFNKKMSLISTTYFQPQLSHFSDYRISHQSAFSIEIAKKLAFKTAFNYTYDAFPVVGIPKQEYGITNGLVYRFD